MTHRMDHMMGLPFVAEGILISSTTTPSSSPMPAQHAATLADASAKSAKKPKVEGVID